MAGRMEQFGGRMIMGPRINRIRGLWYVIKYWRKGRQQRGKRLWL